MNPWWLLALLAGVLLPFCLGRLLNPPTDLPSDFDFDHYKARELTLRGLFDKTKW